MRILVESPSCNAFAGSNAGIGYGWVTRLARRHEVHVVVYGPHYDRGHAGGRAPEIPNVVVHRIVPGPLARAGTLPDFVGQARRRRRALIAAVRPDIVHAIEPNGWPGPRALVTRSVPSVLGPLTGGAALPPRAFVRAVLDELPVTPARALVRGGPRALAVNLVNEGLFGTATPTARALGRAAMRAARVVLLGTSLSPGAVPRGVVTERIAPTGIDLELFHPLPKPGGPFTVLYAARVVAIKGLHLLIDAIGRTGARLRVAGAAPPEEEWYERHCRERADRAGAAVTWLGALPRETLAAEYARADLTCMLGLWETYGMTYVESMAAGTPVLALRAGGAAEIVEPGCGWLVEPTTPSEVTHRVAERIAEAARDPDTLRAAGERGRAAAAERWAWGRLLDRVEDVYRSIL